MNFENRPTHSLRPYPGNARTHSPKQIRQIARSIERFGFNNPVLVDDDDQIIAGHGRVEAAKLLNMKTVPTVRLSHLSESEKKAYILADNRLAEKAGWDNEVLAIELQGLVDLGFDVLLTGFEPAEVDIIIEGKRIILLLDGTWNDSDFGAQDTNIVRIREIIARTLWAENDDRPAPVASSATPDASIGSVTPKAYAQMNNIVFYERGVGTGAFLNRFFGGALGKGLSQNIRRAYKFLSFHYQPGDQVFIFGFSRGAFTARSLVGYIHAAGLLKRDDCTPELEQRAWEFYRTSPNDRLPGIWSSLTPAVHDRSALRVSCLGVFDTVGSLGVPFSQFRVFNRDNYEFHDVELCALVDVNLHAMAIDEQRQPFEATLWRRSKFKKFNTVVEQVWFPGAHADIGGGYIDEEARDRDRLDALDDLPLDWMLKRVKRHFSDFPVSDAGWPMLSAELLRKKALSAQHQPRTGVYFVWPRAFRSLNNETVDCRHIPILRPFSEVNVGRDRHEQPTDEMVHISALCRSNCEIPIEKQKSMYSPKNLGNVLSRIASGKDRTELLPVVDWDGTPLDPNDPIAFEKIVATVERGDPAPLGSKSESV